MRLKWLWIFLAVYSAQALAYGTSKDLFTFQKSPDSSTTQWTLADWLQQKNRMSLLDHWLALHTSTSWFQVDMGGGPSQYSVRTTTSAGTATVTHTSQAYNVNFYLSIFNIYGDYEKTDDNYESYSGAVGLRLLGTSSRTTSLTARYGFKHLQNLTSGEHWMNPFLDGQLQLYIISQFGLQGTYTYYFPNTSNLGRQLKGHSVNAGAFVELGIFRIYGNYILEPLDISANDSTGASTRQRSGFEGGVKLYF